MPLIPTFIDDSLSVEQPADIKERSKELILSPRLYNY
jgi:hypothetical protein